MSKRNFLFVLSFSSSGVFTHHTISQFSRSSVFILREALSIIFNFSDKNVQTEQSYRSSKMSEKVPTISANGDIRKDKVNGRLQSIFNPASSRDLSLLKTNQRAQPSKRNYTPNLNAVRQKQR